MIIADVALPDLSRPPPNFAANTTPPPPAIPPLMSLPPPDFLPDDLLPSLPYYDLPAGLMVPLVKVSNVIKKNVHIKVRQSRKELDYCIFIFCFLVGRFRL